MQMIIVIICSLDGGCVQALMVVYVIVYFVFIQLTEFYPLKNISSLINMHHLQSSKDRSKSTRSLLSPIRADLATNRQTLYKHSIIAIILILFWLMLSLLPSSERVQKQQAQEWNQEEKLEVRQVNPFNRRLKILIFATNTQNPVDKIKRVEVYSVKNETQQQKKLDVQIQELGEYQTFENDRIKYDIGDLHILNDPFFIIKITRDLKGRNLQPVLQTDSEITQNQTSEIINKKTDNATQSNKTKEQSQKDSEKSKQENEKKKEQKEITEGKNKQQSKIKTNLTIEAKLMTKFATVIEFAINYITLLFIIYFVADNPSAPLPISIILVLTSNPLIFIHLSTPNSLTNLIDSICYSAPFLYISLWVYYSHQQLKYETQSESKIYLAIKLSVSLSIYFLNVLRRLHYDVSTLQTFCCIIIMVALVQYLWTTYVTLKSLQHRHKILLSVSISYLLLEIVIWYISEGWKTVMGNMVCQIYGINLLVLLGKEKKVKGLKSSDISETDREVMEMEEMNNSSIAHVQLRQ